MVARTNQAHLRAQLSKPMPTPNCPTCHGLGGYPKCPTCHNRSHAKEQAERPLDAAICSACGVTWEDHSGIAETCRQLKNEREIARKYEDRYFRAVAILRQIVEQYEAAPDGPLGKGFTNKPFLDAGAFLDQPNTEAVATATSRET